MNEEMLKYLMAMQTNDVGGMEDEQSRMIKLAEGLRGRMAPIRGKDVGGNIGNAAYGIAGAIGDWKAKQAAPEITGARQKTFRSLIDSMSKRKPEDELVQLGGENY